MNAETHYHWDVTKEYVTVKNNEGQAGHAFGLFLNEIMSVTGKQSGHVPNDPGRYGVALLSVNQRQCLSKGP